MKKVLSLILAIMFVLSSVFVIPTLAADSQTYTVDFENEIYGQHFTKPAQSVANNATVVSETGGNKCLKLRYDKEYYGGSSYAYRPGFFIPDPSNISYKADDTTPNGYKPIFANNNGDGKVKISFKYKVNNMVLANKLCVTRFSGYKQIDANYDPINNTLVEDYIIVAEFNKGDTTDGWVEVENLIISTKKDCPIYIGFNSNFYTNGTYSEVLIDDIVVEETDESAYTIDVGGVKSTITGEPGDVIDKTKISVPESKIVTDVLDKNGNELTVFPEDTNAVLYVKTALLNDFSNATASEAYLGDSTTNKAHSLSSTYYADLTNGTASLKYISGKEWNRYIQAFAVGDYSGVNPVAYIPNLGEEGTIKLSFKYKPVNVPNDVDIYVFRKVTGAMTANDWIAKADNYFNSNGNITNNDDFIAKKVASVKKSADGSKWVEVEDITFTSGKNTPIYIAVQAKDFKALDNTAQILIDDVILDDNIEPIYEIDVEGTTQYLVGNAGENIDLSKIATPYSKHITRLTDENGNPITKFLQSTTVKMYADTENESSVTASNNDISNITGSASVELSTDYDANGVLDGKSLKYTLNDTNIAHSIYSNSIGSPVYVRNGAKYDLVYKVYYPDSIAQSVDLTAVFMSTDISYGVSNKSVYKQEKSEVKTVDTNNWVEIKQTVDLTGIENREFSAIGVGLIGPTGTVAYVDDVKVVAYLKENDPYVVDFNDPAEYTDYFASGKSIRSAGATYKTDSATGNGYILLSYRDNYIKRIHNFSIPNISATSSYEQYKPENGIIKVSFKYKVVSAPIDASIYLMRSSSGGIGEGKYQVSTTVQTLTREFKKVASYSKNEVTDWVEVNDVYFDSNGDTPIYIAVSNEGGKDLVAETANTEVWIDDVKITTILNTPMVEFDSMGGSAVATKAVIPNEKVGTLPSPTREGYLFDGWYNKDYTTYINPETISPEPSRAIKAYAKWVEIPDSVVSYNTSFETDEFSGEPYQNTQNVNKVTLNNMTENAEWNTEAGHIELVNDPLAIDSGSYFQSVSLMNSDATRFIAIKGKRYQIKYSYYSEGPVGAHSFVYAIVSNKLADQGINASDQVIDRQIFHDDALDVVTVTANFEPKETGFVYFALAARSSNVSSSRYHNIYIDDVSVTPIGSDYKKVTFKNGNTVLDETIGKTGDKIIIPGVPYTVDKIFNGWYSDAELKNKAFITKYPNEDMVLYAGFRDASRDTTKEYYDGLTADLEDTEKMQTYFAYNANMTHGSDASWPEIEFVTGDPKMAHSGSNYLKYSIVSYDYTPAIVNFYDPDTPDNKVYLQPGQEYRVSYWTATLDDSVYIQFDVVLTDPTQNRLVEEVLESVNVSSTDFGYANWVEFEHYVKNETDKPLVLSLRNIGSHNVCMVDDLSVIQLKDVKIKFETNGGNTIETLTTKNYSLAEPPDDPIKDGYEFVGWFTDKELTKQFNFETDKVMSDMTLYAKWKSDAASSDDAENDSLLYEDGFDDTSDDQTDDNEPGERPTLLEAEKVAKNKDTDAQNEGMSTLTLILIIVGSVVLLAAIAFLVIVIIKKKHSRT